MLAGLGIGFISISELDPVLPEHEQHAGIRLRLDELALAHVKANHREESRDNTLLRYYTERLERNSVENRRNPDLALHSSRMKEQEEFRQIMRTIHDLQRKELAKMKNEQTYTDEAVRKAEQLLDITDLQMSHTKF